MPLDLPDPDADQSERVKFYSEEFRRLLEQTVTNQNNAALVAARQEMVNATTTAIDMVLQFRPRREVTRAMKRLQHASDAFSAQVMPLIAPLVQTLVMQIQSAYQQAGCPYGPDNAGLSRWLNEHEELRAEDAVAWVEDFLRGQKGEAA